MGNDVIISVHDICKEYALYEKNIDQLKELMLGGKKSFHKSFKALDGISFEVKKGEHVGIIGTNGSGKSTLLKILTGVVKQTSGNIEVKGRISALLELGAGFNPAYTGLENIFLNGTVMGYTREEMQKKVDTIVDFADIGDFINQPVKNYSSGMFARLAFAVAINVEPDVLIVDEALSVGDTFFQNKCYRKFDELKAKGVTILFVSHDIESIKQMCTRVLWIEQGKQMMIGDSKEVCQAYFNMKMKKQNEENTLHGNTQVFDKIEKKDKEVIFNRIIPKKGDLLSDEIEIIAVNVVDFKGEIVSTLYGGEKYIIEVFAKANKNMEQVIVGFDLTNRKGISFLSYNTYSDSHRIIEMKCQQVLKVTFEFQMPFIEKGPYILGAAIAEGKQTEHIMKTWLHGVAEYEVTWKGYDLSLIKVPYEMNILYVDDVEYR